MNSCRGLRVGESVSIRGFRIEEPNLVRKPSGENFLAFSVRGENPNFKNPQISFGTIDLLTSSVSVSVDSPTTSLIGLESFKGGTVNTRH